MFGLDFEDLIFLLVAFIISAVIGFVNIKILGLFLLI